MVVAEPRSFPFVAMGTCCELRLYGDEATTTCAASAAIAEVRRIERVYSRFRPDSLVAAINAAGARGGTIELDDETADLIDVAFAAYRRSDGLFDVTSGALREVWRDDLDAAPTDAAITPVLARVGLDKVVWERPLLSFDRSGMQIDLGGIGKEYAVDRAAEICRERGVEAGLVDLGGDLAAIGPHPDGAAWRIGVRDPRWPEAALATLFVGAGGVATSGDYERFWSFDGRRYGHIFDPRTGWPVAGLASATVAADTCLEAGIVSTVAMLKGADGPAWLAEAPPHVYVDAEGRLGGSALTRPTSGTAPSASSCR